jgi:hypothetical protein
MIGRRYLLPLLLFGSLAFGAASGGDVGLYLDPCAKRFPEAGNAIALKGFTDPEVSTLLVSEEAERIFGTSPNYATRAAQDRLRNMGMRIRAEGQAWDRAVVALNAAPLESGDIAFVTTLKVERPVILLQVGGCVHLAIVWEKESIGVISPGRKGDYPVRPWEKEAAVAKAVEALTKDLEADWLKANPKE